MAIREMEHPMVTMAFTCNQGIRAIHQSCALLFLMFKLSPATSSKVPRNKCPAGGLGRSFKHSQRLHQNTSLVKLTVLVNSMKLVIPLHYISCKRDSKRCCETTTPESIHTKDESKRGTAFAFIFGVN